MSTTRPLPFLRPPPRSPWRALLLWGVVVTLGHLFVLGWLPMGNADKALPLAQAFSTRTIVVAPPAATGGGRSGGVDASPAPAADARAFERAGAHTALLRDKAREEGAKPVVKPAPPKPVVKPKPKPESMPKAPPQRPEPEPERVATAPDSAPLSESVEQAQPPAEPPSDAGAQPAESVAAPVTAAEAVPAQATPDDGAGQGAGVGAGQGEGQGAGTPGAREALKVPGSVRLDFTVTGQQGAQPMSGVFGELTWLQDGSQYNARLALRVLFRTIRTQTSMGQLGPGGLMPERFSDARRSEVATQFQRGAGQIVFSQLGVPPEPLQPGAQDRLSIILQLSALLAGDPERYGVGSSFSMQTAGARDAEIWQFSVEGEAQQETPAGTYQTRRLKRLPRKPNDQMIELWLAPELGWLPVRIRQTQANGDFADMQLRSAGAP